jgi:hypothetical protein
MDKYTRNTAYTLKEEKRKSYQKKNKIQRKEKRHNTARIKENPMLTLYQHKNTHPVRISIKFYKKEEKIILPRHGRIKTNSENWRKLEVLPLRKQSTD